MAVELWAAALDRPLTKIEEICLQDLLPPERRARLDRLRIPGKRQGPLCAYGLLRLALREQLGWQELPPMGLTGRGKPCFPDFPEVCFNLSHTDGAVLAGLSCCPLGVDIEQVRPVKETFARRVAGSPSPEDFFSVWVRREAREKRTGGSAAALLTAERPMDRGERYAPVETFPGFAAGAAYTAPETLGQVRLLTLEALLAQW